MKKSHLTIVSLSGPIIALLLIPDIFIGAGIVPPPSPMLSADQVAQLYSTNTSAIRTSMIVHLATAAFYIPFTALISVFLRKIEKDTPVFTYTQLISGLWVAITSIVATLIISTAAFRPERSPEITQALNDFAWLFAFLPVAPGIMQALAIAFCVLGNKDQKVLPRWVGYLSVFELLLYLPGCFISIHKSGPLAWDSFLVFGLTITSYTIWLIGMSYAMVQAVRKLNAEQDLIQPV